MNSIPSGACARFAHFSLRHTAIGLMAAIGLSLIAIAMPVQASVSVAPDLLSPADGAEALPQPTVLQWNAVPNASHYRIELHTSPDLGGMPLSMQTGATSMSFPSLQHERTYYWRVRGFNETSEGPWSEVREFTMGLNITPDSNNVLFVRPMACGPCNGSDWGRAVQFLDQALRWAWLRRDDGLWDEDNPLQIWVSSVAGLSAFYANYPADNVGGAPVSCSEFGDTACRRNALVMVPNVQIYGGFAGHETSLGERDWRANRALLVGSNRYRTVLALGDLGVARLDGFEILNGGLTGLEEVLMEVEGRTLSSYYGGGIYSVDSAMVFANLTIYNNQVIGGGPGVYIEGGAPWFRQVILKDNTSLIGSGGAMRVNGGAPRLRNALIADNASHGGDGGAVHVEQAELRLANATLSGNVGAGLGGAIAAYGSSVDMRNTVIWANSAVLGSQIFLDDSSAGNLDHGLIPDLANTVVGPGHWELSGAVHADPRFVAAEAGDFRLQPESPAIDAGSNALYEQAGGDLLNDRDLDGNPRLNGDAIDLGAHEWWPGPADAIFGDRFEPM